MISENYYILESSLLGYREGLYEKQWKSRLARYEIFNLISLKTKLTAVYLFANARDFSRFVTPQNWHCTVYLPQIGQQSIRKTKMIA